jgi:hypothetical protein
VKKRLTAEGLFCQWLPLHQLDLPTLRSVVQAFLVAYPDGQAMLATNSLETPVIGLVGRAGSRPQDLPQLRALAFGAGTFVAVGPGVVVTSADGKEWAKQERAAEDKLDWVLWTGKEFLCGGGKSTLASADGKTWTPSSLKPQGKPMWADGTRFITSSWPGKMSFSPDGKAWQQSPPLTPNGINQVEKAQ